MDQFPTINSLNCPELGTPPVSGITILEYVYVNTEYFPAILVHIRGNPSLKVVGYTDSCGPLSPPILTPLNPPGSLFDLGNTILTYKVTDVSLAFTTCM